MNWRPESPGFHLNYFKGFVLWWWKDTIQIYGYLRGTRHWVVTRLMDDPGAIVIGHSVATSDDINIVSTVNNHQRQDQTQDRGQISWYLCCVLINSLGIYSTSLWLLNLVLNWCKKFIKQPTVCSLHNLKSGCHKMTNTAVTEHYPRLGLFAALIYGAVSCEGCWVWAEQQRQDFPNMERHKPCYSRAKVLLPLSIISGNGSFVYSQSPNI